MANKTFQDDHGEMSSDVVPTTAEEVAAKKSKARAYAIRRHLEELQETRRFREMFDDLD